MIHRTVPALVVLLVLGACTVGERPTRIPGYLAQLEPIAREVNTAIAEVRAALDQPYESDDLFVNAVVDVRFGTRLAVERDRFGRLEPPEEFAADHGRYEELLGALASLARELDGALADEDRAAAAIAAARLEATAARGFFGLTPGTCRFASFDLALCADPGFYGEAETAAHAALAGAAVPFHSFGAVPALVRSGPSFTPYAEATLDEIVGGIVDARLVLEGLELPGDDGEVLVRHLREVAALVDVDDLTLRFPLLEAIASAQELICGLAPSVPPPDPLPAEGGELVEIDGYAEIWFAYAGRCER
ncbi:MAG: hypothetical protein R3290_00110 [Acidimicrobiia bacterium]|nr:hypothetical protein [Acidimicrobiia bacterium]